MTDPAGGVTRYTYDANHRLLTITDPREITFLTNEYDGTGRVVRQTQADGGVWTVAYTVTGGFITSTTVTDPRGNATTSRFNNFGYLISQTDSLGQATTFERQPGTNLLLSTIDPLGRVTQFTYDASGNVTTITDPAGNIRTFTYDPTFNKVTSITDPLGNLTTFEYNAQGNLVATTDPEQNLKPPAERLKTRIAYNQFGQPISTTDTLGNTTTFSYTPQGDLASTTDPLGNSTQRSYDLVSRLITQTDPRGQTTRFSYDILNRLSQIVDALNGVTAFGYDPNGNLLTVTDARGNSITHEYDSMDRLNRRIDQLGAAETFNYDGNGNLVSTTDRKGQTSTFTYDLVNRRTEARYADGAVATFTYDAAGRLVQADDTADPHRPITLTYDPLDRLLAETTSLGTVSYQYDALGRRRQMTVGGQAPVDYTYDANSRLRAIAQSSFLSPVTIDYDVLNRRTLLTLPNGVSTEYVYDPGSRLSALIYRNALGVLGDLTYQYDASGNRIGVGGSFARTLLPDPVPSAAYDAANRQLTFGGKSLAFDGNGNVTVIADAGNTTTYTWDARDRLVRLTSPEVAAQFRYDAFWRRIQRETNSSLVGYLYDQRDILLETQGTTQAVIYLRNLRIDDPLVRIDGGNTTYYLLDALRSVLGLVSESGALGTTYIYEPFGRRAQVGAESGNPFGYSGREHDTPALYFYRIRYFDPTNSRFLQEDRFAGFANDPRSLNRYAYVYNNPLRYFDPLGLLTVAAGAQSQEVAFGTGSSQSVLLAVDDKGNVATTETLGGGGAVSLPVPVSLSGGLQIQVTTARDVAALSQWSVTPGGSVTLPVPIGPLFLNIGLEWVLGQNNSYHGLNVNIGLGSPPGVELHSIASYAWVQKLFNVYDQRDWLQRTASNALPRPKRQR